MVSLDDFSHLLKVLYSTPLRPEQWNEFLDLLAHHTGSTGCYLLVADRSQGLSIQMQGGKPLNDATVKKYAEIAPADPYRLPALQLNRVGVVDMDALVSDHELAKTEMYQLLLAPEGLKHPVAMLLSASLTRMEVVSLWRSEGQGKISKEGLRLLDLLVPHVQAVLDVRRKLGAIRDRMKGVEAMTDASGEPTFLVSAAGRLIHANAAGKGLLEDTDGLCVVKGKLHAANAGMESGLRDLIRKAATGGDGQIVAATTMLLQRRSDRSALQVMASPVPTMRGSGSGTVLLVVNDPERPRALPEDAMRNLYELTAAEVEVASGLLTGYSLEEIAALRKVSVGTVRMQLKSIFAKTKTHKQVELVRLLMSVPGVA